MEQQKSKPELDYVSLKSFFVLFADRYLNGHLTIIDLPPDKRPLAVLEALEKKSPRKAFAGLRQAINDCVEMSFNFSRAEVERLDSELSDRGIVTLSELRRRYSKDYAKIVKRGRIANDSEFYLVQNVLNDRTEKTSEETETLAKLIGKYEAV
jgi:hypothetical protein